MHVGIDARLLYYRQGGITRYITGLAREFDALAAGDQFTVLQSRRDPVDFRPGPGFHRRNLWTPCHHRFEQATLGLELLPLGLDLLHSPDFIPPLRRRCPAVITVHDLAFLRYPELLTKESARYYGRIGQAVRDAEGIIAVSESTRRDLHTLLGVEPERVTVIHEAAEGSFRPLPLDERAAHPAAARVDALGPYLLFVSTLEPRKNLPLLLRAYAILRGRRPDAPRLVLVGRPGWLHEEIYRQVDELRLGPWVTFWGEAAPAELVLLYNQARALAAPSLYEGFSLPPLEAMACGTPVAVSNVSSHPEVVAEAGLQLSPDDAEAWAGALEALAGDEELRADLRRKGLIRAAEFSWERAARETLALYRQVARP